MPERYIDSENLTELLANGFVVLTPNHRTAVQAHEAYGLALKSDSKTRVAPSPAIFPIDIWLSQRFENLFEQDMDCESLTILDSRQELALWKSLIRDSTVKNPLLNLQNAASQVVEAYRLTLQWQIPLKAFKVFQSSKPDYLDDCTAFLEWVRLYQQSCQQKGLSSFAELLHRLTGKLNPESADLPEKIIALGFSNPPPLYQTLFGQLQTHCQLEFMQWQTQNPEVKKFSYTNAVEEMKASARWSQQILEENPDARIGIICNELQQELPRLKRIFIDSYKSETAFRQSCFIQSDVNVCRDIPALIQIPQLLKFNFKEIPTLDYCYNLRSALLLGAKEESAARAAMEMRLRDKAESIVRCADLRFALSQEDRPWHSPLLQKALQQCETLLRQQSKFQRLSVWAELFDQQLSLLLWPEKSPEQTPDQHKALLRSYCSQAFRQLQQLDFIYSTLSISEALTLFEQALLNLSNKEHRQEAPVQILSAQDAEGLRFTHLWFMGLSATQWPQKHYNNPFIPFPLQKSYDIPNSSAQKNYQHALSSLQDKLSNTSQELILSYPRNSEFGEQSATALLHELAPECEIEVVDSSDYSVLLHSTSIQTYLDSQGTSTLESFSEHDLLAMDADEKHSGGVALIENQAECPFRAFALHRLNAKELKPVKYGIPAYDLGNMLHQILELIWQQLQNHKNLVQLSAEQQDAIVSPAIESGLTYLSKKHPSLMRPRFVELERQRLSKLISRWMEIEKQRSPFTVVAHETEVSWQYADLTLQFRIDRIDKSAFDGKEGYVLIDYKSGTKNSISWDDERPSSPQLLLYNEAIAQQAQYQPVNALLYAQVNIDDMQYRGISADADTYPKTSLAQQRKLSADITWQQLQAHWQQSLQNMAQEFLAGYIAVQPKAPDTCQYCHLDAFCRIDEQRDEQRDEQSEEAIGQSHD